MAVSLSGAASDLPRLPRRPLGRVILPLAGLFFLVMIWIPIAETFFLSLFRKEPGEFYFIGLTNYAKLLADPLYLKSFQVSIRFVLMEVPLALVLGLFVALMLNT